MQPLWATLRATQPLRLPLRAGRKLYEPLGPSIGSLRAGRPLYEPARALVRNSLVCGPCWLTDAGADLYHATRAALRRSRAGLGGSATTRQAWPQGRPWARRAHTTAHLGAELVPRPQRFRACTPGGRLRGQRRSGAGASCAGAEGCGQPPAGIRLAREAPTPGRGRWCVLAEHLVSLGHLSGRVAQLRRAAWRRRRLRRSRRMHRGRPGLAVSGCKLAEACARPGQRVEACRSRRRRTRAARVACFAPRAMPVPSGHALKDGGGRCTQAGRAYRKGKTTASWGFTQTAATVSPAATKNGGSA